TSATIRLLPIPASPPTRATTGAPASARSSALCSAAISATRPIRTGLDSRTGISVSIIGMRRRRHDLRPHRHRSRSWTPGHDVSGAGLECTDDAARRAHGPELHADLSTAASVAASASRVEIRERSLEVGARIGTGRGTDAIDEGRLEPAQVLPIAALAGHG